MLTDDGRTDGRTTDAGVTGILIAHLEAFGSGELKITTAYIVTSIFASQGYKVNFVPYAGKERS